MLVSRKASLPPRAFALQIRQNDGLQNLALLSFAQSPRFSKYCYALPAHGPALFCLISPEAFLLTGRGI